MKKESIQKTINDRVELFRLWLQTTKPTSVEVKRLRTCKAVVYDCGDCYLLQSHNTIVAGIYKSTGEGFDFLRMVYGYTATSAQHIAKFFADYGSGCKRYTWRNV
jgi:hypothetical protein|nr:MAG TPA: hypothetical protein [Caudoviricetes sp.]